MSLQVAPGIILLAVAGFFLWQHFSTGAVEGSAYVQSVATITGVGYAGMNNRYAGVVEAKEVIEINPDSDLKIKECFVAAGDPVKAGDPLVRLDEKPLKLGVDQASAGVDAAKALVRQRQDDGTKAEIAEAKAREAQATAGLKLAKTQLGYTTLKAPTDGTVITVATNVGQTAAPGRTLVTLADPADTWVRAFVPEPMLGSIKVGQQVRVSGEGASDVEGTITWISSEPEFTPNNVETRDQRVRLVFGFRVQLPEGASGFLPGQPVDVTLP